MNMLEFDTSAIKQWHIYLVDMNPPRKSKPGKIRPAVVVQDIAGLKSPGATIAPMTTDLQGKNCLHIRIHTRPGLSLFRISDVMVEELQTGDRSFFLKDLGVLTASEISDIQVALRSHLGL